MKTFRATGMVIMAAMLSFTMGSCDNDEAEPNEQFSVDYSDTNNG